MSYSLRRRGTSRKTSRKSALEQATCNVETMEMRTLMSAVVYTVQTNSDNVPPIVIPTGTNAYSANTLRAAVDSANDQPFPVVIQFNTAKFTGGASSTITLTSGLTLGPDIPVGAPSFKIVGPTGNPVTISGGNSYTDFTVSAGISAEFDNLTIANGTGTDGGGIYSAGLLTLVGDTFASDVATGDGGGVYTANGVIAVTGSTFTGDSAPDGGGIYIYDDYYLNATPTITSDTFNNDIATSDGGAIYNYLDTAGMSATLSVTGSKFNGDTSQGDGGAIYNSDEESDEITTSITGSSFTGDSAADDGGAVYSIDGKSMTLGTDTFTNNQATDMFGGAVYDEDYALSIISTTFTGDSAYDGGGGAYFNSDGGTGSAILTVTNSTFTNDKSLDDAAGALYNENSNTAATISGSTFTDNFALTYGGAIYSAGTAGSLTLTNDTISHDSANNEGGGVYSEDGMLAINGSTFASDNSVDQAGGAVYQDGAAIVTLTNSSFTGDSSYLEGGAVNVEDSSVVVTITDCKISNDSTTDDEDGGGIYSESTSLTVTGSTFTSDFSGDEGGGIYNDAGTLTVTNSTFTDNTGGGGGGGISDDSADTTTITGSNFTTNEVTEDMADGGALQSNATTLNLTSDTFTGNSASEFGGAVYFDGGTVEGEQLTFNGNSAFEDGGAIYGDGATSSNVFDSTFSGNSATIDSGGGSYEISAAVNYANDTFTGNSAANYGGGLYINTSGTATITDATISGNSASYAGGGGIYSDGGDIILDGTIVAGNYVVGTPSTMTDLAGINGFDATSTDNIIGDGLNAVGFSYGNVGGNFVGTDFVPINAMLNPLANNGGPTETMKPASTSLAIGNNSNFIVDDLNGNDITALDQRGVLRPQSQGYDIGAYQTIPYVTPDHFVFAKVPGSTTAGKAFNAEVEVFTPGGSLDDGFIDSVTLSSTDGAASLTPTALDFINGVATFSATLNTPGDQKLTVTDTSVGSLVSALTSSAIDVNGPAQKLSISGTVFNDANKDGVQDDGEKGLAGWSVYIDLPNNGAYTSADPETTTNANGQYTLTGLAAGAYIVRVTGPSSWVQTTPVHNYGQHVTLGSGNATGANFGFYTNAGGTISGTVFDDVNGDGIQDNGESGLAGWTVYVDLSNSNKYITGDPEATTNATGQYTLTGLAAGAYIVRVTAPSGWVQTTPVHNYGQHVTLGSGNAIGANFGFYTNAGGTISGTVFDDANADGVEDNGEGGLAGWTVYIDLSNTGKYTSGDPETTTNIKGQYTLSGLAAGTYIVRVIPPSGWSQTAPVHNYGEHVTIGVDGDATGENFGFYFA